MIDHSFQTVLVANRGEIARRVIRTLRALGIRSIAVYSDADADAPHVREADAAYRIGPAAAAQSYLDGGAIIAAARDAGAQAIHPGYGFLSENAEFAGACAAAGIVFIGPGRRALEIMGDKIRSKEHVAAHGVPVVPGFSAAGMSDEQIADAAGRAGYPLLVKPSAGGGGKGMQIVRDPAELSVALAAARRVAASAFGDDTLLLERLIERPRHIEVQVMADAHGGVIPLGERECTLQRRHQKVIEEAPSPVVDAATRARIGAAACAAAASVDYRGAGTVEFLVAADRPEEFFFIEMNTRLQVEHPVTELVTGVDLVQLQLRVAAGAPLGIVQEDVHLDGHAIEARVYAETPSRGFLPAAGEVLAWRAADGVRTDSAVETDSRVTADYDPMIAKVIAHGADRDEALVALDAALAETVVFGLDTNIGFLRALLADGAVRAGDLDTGLIDRLPPFVDPAPTAAALDAAASAVLPEPPSSTGASPLWQGRAGWRMGGSPERVTVRLQDEAGGIHAAVRGGGSSRLAGREATRAATSTVRTDDEGAIWVHADGATHRLRPLTRREAMELRLADSAGPSAAAHPELRAPMPGAVVAVHVADGARVRAGERIVTIEAMKMEHPVTAPHDGIASIAVTTGEQVRREQVLARVTVSPTEAGPE
jgi:acetyl-CoA/propionyl-CoA carboxylase biotin carboxyl carrier protein